MRRRTFLESPAAALTPRFAAAGPAIKLGMDTYSIRDFRWKAIQLLDYAAGQKLDAIQLSSLDDFESLEPAYLQSVKDRAARLGLELDGGVGCVCPTSKSWNPKNGDAAGYVRKGLQVAHAIGARVMRCFMGSSRDRLGPPPIEAHMETTVKVFRAVRNQALDLGVKIALENHSGDMQAREVKSIIEEAGKDFVGSCLDTGNPMLVVEDPLVTLEVLAPYVATSHFRDSALYELPNGAAYQWVAMGDGSIDLVRVVARFREQCPHVPMHLEIITGRPPQALPYLEPDFWKAFPNARAAEFARFVALAKNGRPFMGAMVIAGPGRQPPDVQAALKEQQRRDLERSFAYCRTL